LKASLRFTAQRFLGGKSAGSFQPLRQDSRFLNQEAQAKRARVPPPLSSKLTASPKADELENDDDDDDHANDVEDVVVHDVGVLPKHLRLCAPPWASPIVLRFFLAIRSLCRSASFDFAEIIGPLCSAQLPHSQIVGTEHTIQCAPMPPTARSISP
jgi:hypothetical protein